MILSNENGRIGSCYKLCLGERKSEEEIDKLISENEEFISKKQIQEILSDKRLQKGLEEPRLGMAELQN